MAQVSSGIIAMDVRNGQQVVLKIDKFQQNILSGFFITGRDLMKVAKLEAQQIIQAKKAPVTDGRLERSFLINASFTDKGTVKYELTNDAPYALKVHSGYLPYVEKNVGPDLLKWIENNLGEGVAQATKKRGYIRLGFPSTRRNYDAQIGMRFFDEPFAQITNTAQEKYQQMVEQARSRARI